MKKRNRLGAFYLGCLCLGFTVFIVFAGFTCWQLVTGTGTPGEKSEFTRGVFTACISILTVALLFLVVWGFYIVIGEDKDA